MKDNQLVNYQFGLNKNNTSLLNNNEFKTSSNTLSEYNESNNNTEVKTHVQNNQLYSYHVKSKEISKFKSFEDNCNNVDHNKIKQNPVYFTKISKDDANSSLLNTESLNISRECNELSSINNANISSIVNYKKSIQLCRIDELKTMGLNAELLNGIYHHGFHNLLDFQYKYISNCINKRDVIFQSYPCVGKSVMCFISLLHNIDTSINECQAIILVPTLELALSAQKVLYK